MEGSRLMPFHDPVGRKVEPGNRVWLAARRYAPYEAFRERPSDDPDVDVYSPLPHEKGGPSE